MTAQNQDVEPENNTLKIIGALIALLVLLGLGYGAFAYFSSSSNLNEYRAATADMSMEKITEMKPEERKEYFENMKNLRQKMSDSEKTQADDINRDKMQTQMKEKMTTFFALPPEEKKAALDKDVDRMASMMKAFGGAGGPGAAGQGGAGRGQAGAGGPGAAGQGGAGRGQAGAGGPGAGGPGAGGPGAGGPGAGGPGAGGPGAGGPGAGGPGAGGPGAGGPGAGGPGAGGPPWARGNPNSTPEEKNKRTSDRLDSSSPELRAQMTEYFKLVAERAKERGVQMPNFGGGGTAKGK